MRIKIMSFALAAAVMLIAASVANATSTDKAWICHATGSQTNPFVLIDVPGGLDNPGHSKHENDKLPTVLDPKQDPIPPNLSCDTGENPQPTPPFTGDLQFKLAPVECKVDETGIPGFTVVEAQFDKGELVYKTHDGKQVEYVTIFDYPGTCVPIVPGPTGLAGPAGPAGATGANGATGATGALTAPLTAPQSRKCITRRVLFITLPKTYKGVRSVRVSIGGRKHVLRVRPGRKVRIDFAAEGFGHGQYAVLVKRTGKPTVKRIYTLCADGDLTAYNVS